MAVFSLCHANTWTHLWEGHHAMQKVECQFQQYVDANMWKFRVIACGTHQIACVSKKTLSEWAMPSKSQMVHYQASQLLMLMGIQNIKEHFLLYSCSQSASKLVTLHRLKNGTISKNKYIYIASCNNFFRLFFDKWHI